MDQYDFRSEISTFRLHCRLRQTCRLTADLMERMCRHCTDAAHWSHFGQTYLSHYDICGCSNVRNKAKDGRSKQWKRTHRMMMMSWACTAMLTYYGRLLSFLKSIVSTNAVNKEFWVVKITLKSTQLCEWAFVCDTATRVTVAERLRTLGHRRWISLVKLRLCEYLSGPSVYSSRKGADVRRCLHVRGVYCNHVNEAHFAPPVLTRESPAWKWVRMSARVSSFSFRKPSRAADLYLVL